MSSRKTFRFYFDFVSPYAYLAWTQVEKLAQNSGWEAEMVPVLFAGLLKADSESGVLDYQYERDYIFKDVFRTAQRTGIPFAIPPAHPFNPLLALRICSHPQDRRRTHRLVEAFFTAVWGKGVSISDRSEVTKILKNLGEDPEAVIQSAESVETKTILKQNTDTAIRRGIFGVPSFWAGEELYWGYDSIANLEYHLQGKAQMDFEMFQRWQSLKSEMKK